MGEGRERKWDKRETMEEELRFMEFLTKEGERRLRGRKEVNL